MKRRLTILALTALAVASFISVELTVPAPALAGGAKQIRGTAIDGTGTCDPQTDGVDNPTTFPLFFPVEEGGLNGCLYTYAESSEGSPSGTYRERGHEIFVSHDPNKPGRFETTYLFTAKFDEDGNEIWGRCEHPITAGTGTSAFEGVTGRFDIKDDIAAGNFPYRGHLRF
ncbi:MAG: hypothetical protein HS126_36140 [Anaerolineales bacterium]|nr:hypothetical protein [Anaerolineales bacterium]